MKKQWTTIFYNIIFFHRLKWNSSSHMSTFSFMLFISVEFFFIFFIYSHKTIRKSLSFSWISLTGLCWTLLDVYYKLPLLSFIYVIVRVDKIKMKLFSQSMLTTQRFSFAVTKNFFFKRNFAFIMKVLNSERFKTMAVGVLCANPWRLIVLFYKLHDIKMRPNILFFSQPYAYD